MVVACGFRNDMLPGMVDGSCVFMLLALLKWWLVCCGCIDRVKIVIVYQCNGGGENLAQESSALLECFGSG
jgi:hypothetical protein